MVTVKQNFGSSVNVTLFDSTDGSPLTGLTEADVSPLYYVKSGDSIVLSKTLDTFNFRELDSTNMPGVYQIDFTASELDTAGDLTVTIPANVGVNLEQKNFELEVEPVSNKINGGRVYL